MARGVVESGYPLYPLPMLRAPVDWAVPVEMARMNKVNAEAYARTLDFRTEFGREPVPPSWFKGWVLRQWRYAKAEIVVPVFVLALALPIVVVRRALNPADLPLLAVVGLAGVIWFMGGPHPRYGAGLVWMATALAAGTLLAGAGVQWQRLAVAGWMGFALGTLILPMLMREGVFGSAATPMGGLIVPPAERTLFHQPVRTAVMQPFRTAWGLELDVPIQGDGGWRHAVIGPDMTIGQPLINNASWPGRLLRTPFPDPAVRLRNPASVAHGFRREPAPGQTKLLDALR
jgi:hypothetical protein